MLLGESNVTEAVDSYGKLKKRTWLVEHVSASY